MFASLSAIINELCAEYIVDFMRTDSDLHGMLMSDGCGLLPGLRWWVCRWDGIVW